MTVTVVKVGGSLALYPEKLKQLCATLSALADKYAFVVLPGGGEFADTVRSLDKRFLLSSAVAHRMAILGMDQYGLLLSHLLPKAVIVDSFEKATVAIAEGQVAIFLPSQVMLKDDPLENSWSVTSDSIAAFVADRLKADRLLLVTDVDGVYTADPKKHPDAKLLRKVSVSWLLEQPTRTCIDTYLPKLLAKSKIKCFVVNGLFPSRIEAVLKGKETPCTLITTNG